MFRYFNRRFLIQKPLFLFTSLLLATSIWCSFLVLLYTFAKRFCEVLNISIAIILFPSRVPIFSKRYIQVFWAAFFLLFWRFVSCTSSNIIRVYPYPTYSLPLILLSYVKSTSYLNMLVVVYFHIFVYLLFPDNGFIFA